jgi:hypothetical protein
MACFDKNASLVTIFVASLCGVSFPAAGQSDSFGPNLIHNPGFENADVPSWNPCFASGGLTLESWTREGSLIQTDLLRNSLDCAAAGFPAWNPAGEELVFELQGSVNCNGGNNNGGVSQVVITDVGKEYVVSLEVYIDEYDEMLVQVDNLTLITVSVFDYPVYEWVRVTGTFVAVSNETVFRVTSVGAQAGVPGCLEASNAAIDNVELREVLVVDCPADLDGDGDYDFFDVSAFLTYFQLGDLTADFTGDGELSFFDVSAYLNAFNAGCP